MIVKCVLSLCLPASEPILNAGLQVVVAAARATSKLSAVRTLLGKGIQSNKESLRIVYLQRLADLLDLVELPKEQDQIKSLVAIMERVQDANAAAANYLEGQLALFCLLKQSSPKDEIVQALVTKMTKPSNGREHFALSEKVYMRSVQPCLFVAILTLLVKMWPESHDAWITLLKAVFWCMRQASDFKARNKARDLMKELVQNDEQRAEPLAGQCAIEILRGFLLELESAPTAAEEKQIILDKAASMSLVRSLSTFTHEFASTHVVAVEERMVSLLVLVNHPFLSAVDDVYAWPGLVNNVRAIVLEVDPVNITRKNANRLVNDVLLASFADLVYQNS